MYTCMCVSIHIHGFTFTQMDVIQIYDVFCVSVLFYTLVILSLH